MVRVLLALLLLSACRQPDRVASPSPTAPVSACQSRLFEESRFLVCAVDGGRVEMRTGGRGGSPYRGFSTLEAALGARAEQVAFAMNAGMFDADGRAIGLSIEDGREIHALNRHRGRGNFYMEPNGVFLVRRDGRAEVVTTDAFAPAPDIIFATQSGPMLVIDGVIHPQFEVDGPSRHVRNGVGIDPAGRPLFVISQHDVSFGKFARLFREALGAKNALYLDGMVSSLWNPVDGRRDRHAPIGPMIVVFKPPLASVPDRAGRATP